jgi:DNA processing protein
MIGFSSTQKSYIWLTSFEDLNWRSLGKLISLFGGAKELVKSFDSKRDVIAEEIGEQLYARMAERLNSAYMQPLLEELVQKGVGVITCEDQNYPRDLLQFEDKPFIIYTLGDTSLLEAPSVTIVGSRRCTRYGIEQTRKIARGLCEYGFTIVSGLAEGIDTVANSEGLEHGRTIAVTAGGFDHVYPASNRKLFDSIVQRGLVISQFPPNRQNIPYMFPLRNRVMAAISLATVVTEAGESSGALITADIALNLGKELFVLPGNVNSKASEGANRLIKEMQGCMITGYQDILISLGIEIKGKKEESIPDLTKEERVIYEVLQAGEAGLDELVRSTGMGVQDVNAILSLMEIKGLIKKLPGNKFAI